MSGGRSLNRYSNIIILVLPPESYVRQIVPSQCLAQPMAMPLAILRSWGQQAVSIMGQTSRCCMVCLMPQSHVSCSLENPHFNMFTLDRPTCVHNWLSAFQVVQGFSAAAERCSSALMLRCTLVSRGSSRSLHVIGFCRRVDGLGAFDEALPQF